jgi:hypothetical protein
MVFARLFLSSHEHDNRQLISYQKSVKLYAVLLLDYKLLNKSAVRFVLLFVFKMLISLL